MFFLFNYKPSDTKAKRQDDETILAFWKIRTVVELPGRNRRFKYADFCFPLPSSPD